MKQLLSVPFQLQVLRVQHGFGRTQRPVSCSSSEAACRGLQRVRPLPCGGNLSLPLWVAAFESLASNPGSQAREMLCWPPLCSAARWCCPVPLGNGLCLRTHHGTIISWGLAPPSCSTQSINRQTASTSSPGSAQKALIRSRQGLLIRLCRASVLYWLTRQCHNLWFMHTLQITY